ncbi:hypothetical protein D6D06_08866 [Aureobasidium pullulans]|nr:hypothetical protein D6D06_08866 [Aureobasidium pullulans]
MDNTERGLDVPHLPPEILQMIIKCLADTHDDKTLLRAALVNKEWLDPATDFLWRSPPPGALAALPRPRRQYYAAKITELYFRHIDEGKYHSQYKNLQFTRLTCIGLDQVRLRKNQKLFLSQYIQPRLESFSYWGGHPCEDALERLESDCPRLNDFHAIEPLELIFDAEKLNKFLRNRTSLMNVEFGRGWEYSLPKEVLAQLSELENLQRLDIVPFLKPLMVREVWSDPENKFKNLRILHIRLPSVSVGVLAACTPLVDTLFLEVKGSEQDVLQALEPMQQLRHLELEFHNYDGGVQLSVEGIKTLGKLPDLEILLIRPWTRTRAYYNNLKASWLGDDEFADMMSSLPKLKSLVFHVECSITLKSITSLGKTHPDMYCCDLHGVFVLDDWSVAPGPVLPNLRRLAMDAPDLRGRTRASSTPLPAKVDRIIDIVLRQVPMIEQLGFHDFEQNVLADQVLERFAVRIDGAFNEKEAAAFRPWSWLQKNGKKVSRTGADHANDMELFRRTAFGHIMDLMHE